MWSNPVTVLPSCETYDDQRQKRLLWLKLFEGGNSKWHISVIAPSFSVKVRNRNLRQRARLHRMKTVKHYYKEEKQRLKKREKKKKKRILTALDQASRKRFTFEYGRCSSKRTEFARKRRKQDREERKAPLHSTEKRRERAIRMQTSPISHYNHNKWVVLE